jgi:L-fuconate dehydratase
MAGKMRVTRVLVHDVRFPTSVARDGSDAMNPDPDYSATYVVLETSRPDLSGHGFTFTIGYGNEICAVAALAVGRLIEGEAVEELVADLGSVARRLTGESHLRWLGPEKGVVALATAAVLNALWDLAAKLRGLPLWRLLASLPADDLVRLVDFRYLTDALTPNAARDLLLSREAGIAERVGALEADGYPAYATSPGWLGYDDEKMARLAALAVGAGFRQIKLKVGAALEDDERRLARAREVVGPDVRLAIDANQVWGVPEAIGWLERLRRFDLAWVEEPTSPDDVLGHRVIAEAIAPVPVATGEQVHSRVVFKQFFQAKAIGVCQVDACRMASVNEVLAVLLLAAHFGVPVCPHAGGVGLCELVPHLAALDYVRVSGAIEGRTVEWVDHLHEHFVEPAAVVGGRYRLPERPGYAEMRPEALDRFRYPDGPVWRERLAERPPGIPTGGVVR